MTKKKFPLLIILPALIIVGFTIVYPIIRTFLYSLQYYTLTEPEKSQWIGFKNYKKVLMSPDFHRALVNSITILLIVMVLGLLFSMMVALILNQRGKLTPFLTAIAIIPWALPPIVNGIIWKFIFFPGYGLFNKILMNIGLVDRPILFTTHRFLFLAVIAIVVTWRIVPFSAIVILANLQNIPKDYYEAITLEGSTRFQMFRRITLPLLLPSLGVVLINLTTTAINVFDEIIAMTGFQYENQTLLVYNYSHTFQFLDFGLGSTISYVIMMIAGIFGYYYVKNMTVEKVY
ncbi:MAG: sugar ABC transporter permease [Tissierellia bacterium]|nr:sugar ABC transporter permease [Tissierellia bacterium]